MLKRTLRSMSGYDRMATTQLRHAATSRKLQPSRRRVLSHAPTARRRWLRLATALAGGAAPSRAPTGRSLDILDWLVREGAHPAYGFKVARQTLPGVGGALVATADIAPGETILSVPLPLGITSSGEGGWAQEMSEALLVLGFGGADPWLACLPPSPPLPWLGWSEAEVAALQDEDTVAEVQHMAAAAQAVQAVLADKGFCDPQQLEWALAMVHSRSFVYGGQHLWVPGIDLCNHTFEPNATVRCLRSPGACQGRDAVEEVCPPSAAGQQEPDRFELVAGEEGIAAGQEVTISYGSHPGDVFLLMFGFLPEPNPHDAAALFFGLEELVAFFLWWWAGEQVGTQEECAASSSSGHESQEDEAAAVEAVVRQLEQELGPREQYYRLVVTAAGFDARLLQAADALLRIQAAPQEALGALLAARCRSLLSSFPTTLEEDGQLLQELQGSGNSTKSSSSSSSSSERLLLAVHSRSSKKRMLLSALQAMGAECHPTV